MIRIRKFYALSAWKIQSQNIFSFQALNQKFISNSGIFNLGGSIPLQARNISTKEWNSGKNHLEKKFEGIDLERKLKTDNLKKQLFMDLETDVFPVEKDHVFCSKFINTVLKYTHDPLKSDVSKEFATIFRDGVTFERFHPNAVTAIAAQLAKLGFRCQQHKDSAVHKEVCLQFLRPILTAKPIKTPLVLSALSFTQLIWTDLTPEIQKNLIPHIMFWVKDGDVESLFTLLRALAKMRFPGSALSAEDRHIVSEEFILDGISTLNFNDQCEMVHLLTKTRLIDFALLSSLHETVQLRLLNIVTEALKTPWKGGSPTDQAAHEQSIVNLFLALAKGKLYNLTVNTRSAALVQAGADLNAAVDWFLKDQLPQFSAGNVSFLYYQGFHYSTMFHRKSLSYKSQVQLVSVLTAAVSQMSDAQVARSLTALGGMALEYRYIPASIWKALQAELAQRLGAFGQEDTQITINGLGLMYFDSKNMTPEFKTALLTATRKHSAHLQQQSQKDYLHILCMFGRMSLPVSELLQWDRNEVERVFTKQLRDCPALFDLTLTMMGQLNLKWETYSSTLQRTVATGIASALVHPRIRLANLLNSLSCAAVPLCALDADTARSLMYHLERQVDKMSGPDFISSLQWLVSNKVLLKDLSPELQSSLTSQRNQALRKAEVHPWQAKVVTEIFNSLEGGSEKSE